MRTYQIQTPNSQPIGFLCLARGVWTLETWSKYTGLSRWFPSLLVGAGPGFREIQLTIHLILNHDFPDPIPHQVREPTRKCLTRLCIRWSEIIRWSIWVPKNMKLSNWFPSLLLGIGPGVQEFQLTINFILFGNFLLGQLASVIGTFLNSSH